MTQDREKDTEERVLVSLVTPVYRGEAYLPDLVEAIAEERERWQRSGARIDLAEAIFVLDEPVDGSAAVLRALQSGRSWLRIVELSRNFGQHSATAAGVLHSSGDWVVTLDEDLQHRPACIPNLLAAVVEHGADIVYAAPRQRVHGAWRDRFSRGIKRVVARLAGHPDVVDFNSFRLLRGDLARAASSICAQHTYFDMALSWYSRRVCRVKLDVRDQRSSGGSGYSFWRLVQHAKRLLFTSDFHVLRYTLSAAAMAVGGAVVYGAWILYRRLFSDWGYDVSGWPSLALMILVFGAATVFLLGLLLEFVQVVMLQLQGKPAFFVLDRSKDPLLARELPRLLEHADIQS